MILLMLAMSLVAAGAMTLASDRTPYWAMQLLGVIAVGGVWTVLILALLPVER